MDVLAEQIRTVEEREALRDWHRALIEAIAAELRCDDEGGRDARTRMTAAAQAADRARRGRP